MGALIVPAWQFISLVILVVVLVWIAFSMAFFFSTVIEKFGAAVDEVGIGE